MKRRKFVTMSMSVLGTWKNRQEGLEQLISEHSYDCTALLKPDGKICMVRILKPLSLTCFAKFE